MKKFLKNGLLFIPFFLAVYVVIVCFIGEIAPYHFRNCINYRLGSYGYLHTKIREIENYKNVDVLFVGTSHAYRGFDVRIFKNEGYTTFNLGSSIQTPIQTNLLFRRYLDKLQPKLVVYDVNPEIFGSDGVEASLDLISNDRVGFDTFKMAFEVNDIKTYNTFIFAFYQQIINANEGYKEPVSKEEDTYVSGGFVQKKLKTFTPSEHYKKVSYTFSDKQLDYFTRNLKLLKDKKIPYVLVHIPLTKKLYHSKQNYAEVTNLMTQKFQSRYYDFNPLVSLNDTLHFYDDNHMNQNGVRLFDAYFIAKFKQDGLLPQK